MGWRWLDQAVLLAVHDMQLAEHGGATGLRDAALLDPALAKPLNLAAYETPDAIALAAAYGFGIARNHPFIDGNKRTAFVAAELFLRLNGWQLVATEADCVVVMLDVSAGSITELEFAQWIRQRAVQQSAD